MWCDHHQTSTNSNKNCIVRNKTMIMNTCKNNNTNLEPPTCLVFNISSPTTSPLQQTRGVLPKHMPSLQHSILIEKVQNILITMPKEK